MASYFGAEGVAHPLDPNYNVAPTNDIYVIYEDGQIRQMAAFHWGLVPFWAKDPSIGSKMINARADGVATKPAFRHAFKKQRCIIPVDGFYEWRKIPGQKTKQPYFIERPDGEPFAFAGLWETWRGPDKDGSEQLRSCSIITTDANAAMAPIHDRMPVILPPSAWDGWLDVDNHDVEGLGKLLVPAPPRLITMHPVSTEVNYVRNKDAHLIDPVDVPDLPPLQPATSA